MTKRPLTGRLKKSESKRRPRELSGKHLVSALFSVLIRIKQKKIKIFIKKSFKKKKKTTVLGPNAAC